MSLVFSRVSSFLLIFVFHPLTATENPSNHVETLNPLHISLAASSTLVSHPDFSASQILSGLYPDPTSSIVDYFDAIPPTPPPEITPSRLFLALLTKKEDIVDFINKGGSVNTKYAHGLALLHFAATVYRGFAVVKYLLKMGAFVDIQNADGDSPLHLALSVDDNHYSIQELVENSADVNLPNHSGVTPLHIAFSRADTRLVGLLLRHSSDRMIRESSVKHPLYLAVENGLSNMVELLLSQRADPNLPHQGGSTLLHVAVCARNLRVVDILIQNRANVDSVDVDGRTPLHIAATLDIFMVRLLLAWDAKVDPMDNNGITPWELASQVGQLNVANHLRARGFGERLGPIRDLLIHKAINDTILLTGNCLICLGPLLSGRVIEGCSSSCQCIPGWPKWHLECAAVTHLLQRKCPLCSHPVPAD